MKKIGEFYSGDAADLNHRVIISMPICNDRYYYLISEVERFRRVLYYLKFEI